MSRVTHTIQYLHLGGEHDEFIEWRDRWSQFDPDPFYPAAHHRVDGSLIIPVWSHRKWKREVPLALSLSQKNTL